ncbi:MAG TPA: molybdopterin-dependent oxidoreductase [Acetobacteraceae bacterium]
MLTKQRPTTAARAFPVAPAASSAPGTLDRRGFLRTSGLAAGGLAALGGLGMTTVEQAAAGEVEPGVPTQTRKTVCTHCSVGCSVLAKVQNGVWVAQEANFDSPNNLGTHCAKGAAVRELTHGDRRLKYPMKLEGGQWKRLSWDQAISEIGDKMLAIREKSGPDSVFWLGSAKFSNEGAYLFRKFAALWGTNTCDHQARICHSTTVAGVANTFGYGAMTNSFNDIGNSKAIMIMGGNPAEAHPVSLQHLLRSKEINQSELIVIDPRFTRTAAHATEHVRIRPGTDIPIIWSILWHVFENGWEDKQFIENRVYGMDEVRKEVANWNPEESERVTGVPRAQLRRVAEIMAHNRPSTLIWCMGATQKTVGTANVRAYSILQLALGNMGQSGGGTNIFRGHCNVQGATDMGLDVTTLPAYLGLDEAAWKHFARVWDLEYDYLVSRFASKKLMETKGIPSTRWFDAVLAEKGTLDQPDNVRAMVAWGHAANSITREPVMREGMNKLDLLLVVDPHPTTFAISGDRKDGTYLLPACTQFEQSGTVTGSNRSIQWREQVVKPIFESKQDTEIMLLFAKKFGFAEQLVKNIAVDEGVPVSEDILREINRGCFAIGYSGQSPERLKLHAKHQADFDPLTLQATSGPCAGEYYGLPWPCWGTPELKHPGTGFLYNTAVPVKEGGSGFRARWGVEREGVSLLATDYPKGSEIRGGYPEFTVAVLKKLGWDGELTEAERAVIDKVGGGNVDAVSWQTDLSGGIQRVAISHGCAPFGNGKARAFAWNLVDPVPVHREPIRTPRRDLIDKYPALSDRRDYRLPYLGRSLQVPDVSKDFPMILTSGRLVEYEGGGDETRSNRWLAEIVEDAYCEVNPQDATRLGIRDRGEVWLYGVESSSKAKYVAHVSNRTGPGVVFVPFHFGGMTAGVDNRGKYPPGLDPIVLGHGVNQLTTYGYDSVTHMQETKVTLCRVEAA